jgi:hypothetical protein
MEQFENEAGVDATLLELCGVSSALLAIRAAANDCAEKFRKDRQTQQVHFICTHHAQFLMLSQYSMHPIPKKAAAEFEKKLQNEKRARAKAENDALEREKEVTEQLRCKEEKMACEANELKMEIEAEKLKKLDAQNKLVEMQKEKQASGAEQLNELEQLKAQIQREKNERQRAERQLADMKQQKEVEKNEAETKRERRRTKELESKLAENEQLQSKANVKAERPAPTKRRKAPAKASSSNSKPKRTKAAAKGGDVLALTKERLIAEQEARTQERLDKLRSKKK